LHTPKKPGEENMPPELPAYTCPACGGPLALHFRYAKLITCAHCHNGLLLEDQALKLAGVQSVMAEYPSLFELYREYRYRKLRFTPVGHARFEYAEGFWDEWWIMDDQGQGQWLSVDEGDYALEQAVPWNERLFLPDLQPGKSLSLNGEKLLITERGSASCSGVRGELPELIRPGERYDYLHLSGPEGRLLTLEVQNNEFFCYEGQWIDPFEVTAA
jgi:hypothetical protein